MSRGSLSDRVRKQIVDRLNGVPAGVDESVVFTGVATVAVRGSDLRVCGDCRALVLAADTAVHAEWHAELVSAQLEPMLGDGTQVGLTEAELMERLQTVPVPMPPAPVVDVPPQREALTPPPIAN